MKNIFYALVLFSILCSCSHNKINIPENAQIKETVYKTESPFSSDIKDLGNNLIEVTVFTTWKQDIQKMRDELRERAEIEILQYKGLLQIGSETLSMQYEGEEYFDLFSNIISSTVYGRIDSISSIYEKTILIKEQPYFVMRFNGHFIEEEPDLSFSVNVSLNRTTFSNSDELNLQVITTKPAYIIVFNFDIEEDKFDILYPTPDLPYNKLQPNITFSIPPKNFHKKIRVYSDEKKKKQSSIFVIATKEKWSVPIWNEMKFEDFKNWLGKIPLPIRAIVYESYVVYNQ